jgi:hypothetical protein
MEDNDYDETMRHLSRRAGAAMMHWLLQLDTTHIRFGGWIDPVLLWAGVKQRVCDLIARLADLDKGGIPTACIVEFQTEPDPKMFGRLMVAGGMCWLDVKPVDLPGDRFELSAVVVNLTGTGDCARDMSLGSSEWKLKPFERNLESFDARLVLEDIALGKAPRELLALIPVMKNGADQATIDRWLEIAGPEKDPEKRGDYALAGLFAGLVERSEQWRKALEAFKMNESPVAREWRAEAELKGQAKMLVAVLKGRFGTLPDDLLALIRSNTDPDKFERWAHSAATSITIEEFRKETGL